MPRRYRVIPLHGVSAPEAGGPPVAADNRAHGVQVGCCGGRIIGDGWRLDRVTAERFAEALEDAFEAGQETGCEA